MDKTKWTSHTLPTRELIDRITPKNPVAVSRHDGHMIFANSLALELSGITDASPDPAGGIIVRARDISPTGALKDAAADLVTKNIPPPSHARRLQAIESPLRLAASLGRHRRVCGLLEEHALTTRIYAAPLITQVDDKIKIGIRCIFGGSCLRIGAGKAYADSSLGSRTAYF